jgi:hypothetical protein
VTGRSGIFGGRLAAAFAGALAAGPRIAAEVAATLLTPAILLTALAASTAILLTTTAAFAEPDTAEAPAVLAAGNEFFDPESVVVVVPQDGRPAQPVAIVRRGSVSYLPLGSLARAFGVTWSWDPYTYRGWIETDSVRTRYTFDSPLLMHGPDLIQMTDAVSYDGHGVLIPLDYLSLLKTQLAGDRAISWRPAEGRFVWSAPLPHYHQVRLTEIGHRSSLRITGPRPQKSLLLWSPVAGLDILLDGLVPHPESLSVSPPRGLFAVSEISGWGKGSRVRVQVEPKAIGAAINYDEREGFWELEATASIDESERGSFRPLRRADYPARPAPNGPILFTVRADRASDPVEAVSALEDLADRISRILADTLGQEVKVLKEDDPLKMAASANTMSARCMIALRIDGYGAGGGQMQVWTAAPRLRWEPLSVTESARAAIPRPLLWSETPALSAGASERLASTIASHLESLLAPEPVVRGRRPSLWLEGLTMPSVMIYPALSTDLLSLERLMDPDKRAALARAIAFGISEALSSGAFEGIQL